MGEIAKWLLALGGGGTLVGGFQAIQARRKVGAEAVKIDADAAAVISQTALELLEPLRAQIADLKRELGEAKEQLDQAKEQLDRVKAKAEDLEQNLDACRASNRTKDDQIHALRQQRAASDRET